VPLAVSIKSVGNAPLSYSFVPSTDDEAGLYQTHTVMPKIFAALPRTTASTSASGSPRGLLVHPLGENGETNPHCGDNGNST